LPLLYRTGANPGFHEAVGDTIALSVSTPQHLKTVNLLEKYDDSVQDNINALFHMALERVAFLPFGLLIDKWRWDVFSGTVKESEWNSHWWKLREQYQMVSPPSTRGEEFFDPGAKYHVPADSQYIAYFVAHILEFSFYRSLCVEASQYDPANPSARPLHKCDFYNSKEAGAKLKAGLELGYSKHWSVALEELTGDKEISAEALLEYFKPLQDFLKKQNEMSDLLDKYDKESAIISNKLVKAEWAVATDSENATLKEEQAKLVLESAAFNRKYYEDHFKGVNPEDYTNELTKRQLKYLTKLGRDALDDNKLEQLTKTTQKIEEIYNTAKICPFNKKECDLKTEGLTLDPDITKVMTESTNFDELKYTWEEWREKSGKLMRNDYKTYVNLANEAAKLNGNFL
jgi:peptidyl-dipeptidase A